MMDFMCVDYKGEEEEEQDDEQQPPQNSAKLCCANKSLEELTDQDVMQLTREDCRRYLKDKGMRRPSWNKAQAVQQVLSLRSLCRKRSSASEVDLPAETKNAKLDQSDGKSPLTIFYAGSVSVFEDVSADKAYAIMLLASSIKSWPPDGRARLGELPQARKASLQRFLQERKERRTLKENLLNGASPPSETSKAVAA